ncbi:hypothetical protein KIW84_064898 [Lathyrus oleraceus]|uniref:SAM-dependent MTase RsmB/NOP-type domain-containing protein n=1 Tax=Pisum sativum TaxID=3888 RepID=A0A9D4WBG9_PEA|nr:hypothetical protein KIW84_064898 [Pisum sativum]
MTWDEIDVVGVPPSPSFKILPMFAPRLHSLQILIAMRGLSLLKVGGRMVYSTCSMNPIENEVVVVEVLRRCGESVKLPDVSSWKGLKLIKRHCQSVVPVVFNIIVHLQSPHIFYVNLRCKTVAGTPDPGSAILMYIEVLTTVSRRHGLFSRDVCHVGHMLHIPAALFQNFHQHRISKAFVLQIHLWHRPSECKQCVAHLEAFVIVLLNCLETVLENNKSTVNEGWFCWEVEEEVEINTAAIIPVSMQNSPRNSSDGITSAGKS